MRMELGAQKVWNIMWTGSSMVPGLLYDLFIIHWTSSSLDSLSRWVWRLQMYIGFKIGCWRFSTAQPPERHRWQILGGAMLTVLRTNGLKKQKHLEKLELCPGWRGKGWRLLEPKMLGHCELWPFCSSAQFRASWISGKVLSEEGTKIIEKSFYVFIFLQVLEFKIESALFIVQSLSCIWLLVTPWTAICQASLSFTIKVCSSSSIESVMLPESVLSDTYLS